MSFPLFLIQYSTLQFWMLMEIVNLEMGLGPNLQSPLNKYPEYLQHFLH